MRFLVLFFIFFMGCHSISAQENALESTQFNSVGFVNYSVKLITPIQISEVYSVNSLIYSIYNPYDFIKF